YDQSGQQAAQASSTSLPAPENAGIDPDRTWIIGTIPTLSNETNPSSVGIPSGFVGSVVVTSTSGLPMDVMVIRSQFDTSCGPTCFKLLTVGGYPVPATPPSGNYAYVPAIRKGSSGVGTGSGGEATAFTLMNTQTSAQDYNITFWGPSGAPVRTDK